MSNLIIYELNEVPVRLFMHYADAFQNSAFARLVKHSRLFETHAADVGDLSPWISWPSLHRGVSNVEHGISELGQNLESINNDFPPIWQILASEGLKVGLFGSLQSFPVPLNRENYSFYIPDTFAASSETIPAEMATFQAFNLGMTGVNGRNVTSKILMKEAFQFAIQSPFMGLTGDTMRRLITQVVAEKFNNDRIVRRRSSQTEIAFDLFYSLQKKNRPDISFFFTNHLASSMHRYWPTIFPEDYLESKFDKDWLIRWKSEIPHSVVIANRQISRLMHYCDVQGGRLIVASSMGQAAVDGVKMLYKQALIDDVSKLLSVCGIGKDEWVPRLAMAPRVVLRPISDTFFEKIEKLKKILVCGQNINVELLETGDVRLDIFLLNKTSLVVEFEGNKLTPEAVGIKNVDLQDAAGSNAYHIPEGVFLVYDPKANLSDNSNHWMPISVLDVAPSILRYYGVEVPTHMSGDKKLLL